jgi:CDP-diacylglycerol--serine O-phosphatidyltransferase
MNLLANFITLLSLACGFISIIFSLEQHFTYASWAIILSVVLDGMDGQIARRNPLPSEFGKELDSLVDVVSFGIAPSLLGYVFIYMHFHIWAVLVLFGYLTCSVLRLAKYNIISKAKGMNYFLGLPTTVSGGILASFILIYRKKEDMFLPRFMPDLLSSQFAPVIFLSLTVILSFLMVSRIRYLNLDGIKEFFGRKMKFTLLAGAILFLAAYYLSKAGLVIFAAFLIYLIFSPIVVKRLKAS